MTERYGGGIRIFQKNANSVQWDGPHKRISFDSEDPESTLSGSETRETRPGWPPDDMCADSTRYKGSFDEREREGLQLLSPVVQRKVLKLQRIWTRLRRNHDTFVPDR